MDEQQPVRPLSLPDQILKRAQAINLYFIAVGALAAVVVLIPLVAVWVNPMPDQLWTGWTVCIGGLIAMLGAGSNGAGNG